MGGGGGEVDFGARHLRSFSTWQLQDSEAKAITLSSLGPASATLLASANTGLSVVNRPLF